MTDKLEFTVIGKPQPAGSKRAFPIRRGGRVVGVATTDDNKRSKPWQAIVSSAALDALAEGEQLRGPLLLKIDFYLARPAGHYGTGRNAGTVRSSAPTFPVTRPDATKLVRGIEDALTGIAWRDDAQVVSQLVRKLYGTPERAEVLVAAIPVDGMGP